MKQEHPHRFQDHVMRYFYKNTEILCTNPVKYNVKDINSRITLIT